MERKKEGEREGNPAACFLLPAPCPDLLAVFFCFFCLLTHFSSYCLHYLNAWNRLPGDGCLKQMVSAHCAVQCINHSLKLKKLVSVTVHLPLYSTVKYSLKSCFPSLTNNMLRVVCHFPHRKQSVLDLAHITTDVLSSGSFIPHAHFELSLVMVSYYGYEV